jgi:hypothetical protein
MRSLIDAAHEIRYGGTAGLVSGTEPDGWVVTPPLDPRMTGADAGCLLPLIRHRKPRAWSIFRLRESDSISIQPDTVAEFISNAAPKQPTAHELLAAKALLGTVIEERGYAAVNARIRKRAMVRAIHRNGAEKP